MRASVLGFKSFAGVMEVDIGYFSSRHGSYHVSQALSEALIETQRVVVNASML